MSGSRYDSFEEAVSGLSEAEVVVGIPSRNTAHTINYVLKNVEVGLRKYLRNLKSGVVVCDGLSTDGTVEVVKALRKYLSVKVYVIPNLKSRGKGGAVKTLIDVASSSANLSKLILLDSDLRSITPEWVPLLAGEGCDLTTPYYVRDRFDATITNFVARPLTTATYGVDVRQPIGGDFGLSNKLVRRLRDESLWSANPWSLYFGVDIMITHVALATGCEVCQAYLGAKIHEAKDPGEGLKGMFTEVTGSLYVMLYEFRDAWLPRRVTPEGLVAPKLIRGYGVPKVLPPEVRVNRELALKIFKDVVASKNRIVKEVLRVGLSGDDSESGLSRGKWVKALVNGFKAFANAGREAREELLEALFGLWQGRLFRYYREVQGLTDKEVEEYLADEVRYVIQLRNELKSLPT